MFRSSALLKSIAHGNCFFVIGSGASIESGYPSWDDLTQQIIDYYKTYLDADVYDDICTRINDTDPDSRISNILSVYDTLEYHSSKINLVTAVKKIFDNVIVKENDLYDIISKWPVSCYLTTNYDSELLKYLDQNSSGFSEIGNTVTDFASIRIPAEKCVVKIHGDFKNPDSMIISGKDYKKIRHDQSFEYWRSKIRAILQLSTVVIIGYSVQDPDFQDQLENVKDLFGVERPIYMFAPDMSPDKVSEYRSRYNIKIIPYQNKEGNHFNLKRLIKQYDAFIPKRGDALVSKTDEHFENLELATSLYIYNETVLSDSSLIARALCNCILILCSNGDYSIASIAKSLKDAHISADTESIRESCCMLEQDGYLSIESESCSITEKGLELLAVNNKQQERIKTLFEKACYKFLNSHGASDEVIGKLQKETIKGLNILFQKRGLDIAKKIMVDDDNDLSLAFDIAGAFESTFSLLSQDEYDYFLDLILFILQTPTEEIRDYLAILCNTYFMYHILGHDKKARDARLEHIKGKRIIIDSNVIIPILATGCADNRFCNDLLEKLLKVNKELYITEKIFEEIVQHALWAIKYFNGVNLSDENIVYASLGCFGYRQNLFVQGGMLWCQNNGEHALTAYFEECLGHDFTSNTKLRSTLLNRIMTLGINITAEEDLHSLNEYHIAYEASLSDITYNRKALDSFRSELQCETEADLLAISKFKKFVFLTNTNNLKKLDPNHQIMHCSPESLYRFLITNDHTVDLSDLYECMTSDLYNAGLPVLNKESLDKLARMYFHGSDLTLKETARILGKDVNDVLSQNLIDESKLDLDYPGIVRYVENKAKEDLKMQSEYLESQMNALKHKQEEVSLNEKDRRDLIRYRDRESQRKKKQRNRNKRKKNR